MSNDEKQTQGWFRTIGDVRNSLLVAASLVYLLGYAVWSMHAWDKNLGLLPLLDSQYFVAGAVPTITLWLAFYGFKGGRRLIGILEQQLGSGKQGWRLYLSRALIAVFLMAMAVFLISTSDWFKDLYPSTAERISLVSAFIGGVSAFFAPWSGGLFQRYFRFVMLGYLLLVLSALGAVNSFWVLGWLPQEFGGMRPRCASISVQKSLISTEMLEQIFSSHVGVNYPKEEIIQSDLVAVLYSGNYILLTKPQCGKDTQCATSDNEDESIVYEVPRNIIKGITWSPSCP